MVARAFLKNSVSMEEWLAKTTFMKYCFLGTTTLLWVTVFSYESLLIISLRFLYICKEVQQYVISAFIN